MKKHTIVKTFILAVVGVFAHNISQAQTALSLQQAVETATGTSKLLKIDNYKTQAADFKIKETAVGKLPTIKFTGRYTRLSNNITPFALDFSGSLSPIINPLYAGVNALNAKNGLAPITPQASEGGSPSLNPQILDQFNTQLTVQQVIWAGGKVNLGIKIAEINRDITKIEYDKDKADVILNTKLAYWNLYKAQQVLEQLKTSEKQVATRIADLENLAKLGLATENDVLKLKVQSYNIQLQKTEMENTISIANTGLNSVLNQELAIINNLTTTPNTSYVVKGTMQELIEKASSQRHELKINDMRVKTAQVGEKIANSGYLPQVVAQVNGYYANPNQRNFPQTAVFKETADASLVLSWDVWTWNTPKYQAEQYKLQALQAQELNSFTKDNIALEITQHFLSLKNALARLNLATETVKQAEENYRVTNSRVKNGLALSSDLVDAEVSLLNAKISQTSASVDYEMGLARLERAVGGLE
jgi:outer membrane protein